MEVQPQGRHHEPQREGLRLLPSPGRGRVVNAHESEPKASPTKQNSRLVAHRDATAIPYFFAQLEVRW